MGRHLKRVLMVVALLQCFVAAAWSQGISGVVKDSSGAVLPGVTVQASSPVLIEKTRSTVSDSQGQYKLVDLRPGVYSVTFTSAGFSTAKRDGISLVADFTATVNIDLAVGSIDQTVEVTAAAPLVDVANVNQESNLSQKLMDTTPESKNVLGFSALTVGAIIPQTAQDVGGSKGEVSVRLAFHGSHAIEQKLLLDGMIYNTLLSVGNRTFFPNPASTEEFTISNGAGGSAEFLAAGAVVNTVPKDGGNKLNGYFYTDLTNSALQASNLNSSLQQRGLVVSSGINKIYDFEGALGGAIVKDHLWFYSAYRNWGDSEHGASLQYNANPNSYTYTPNGVAVLAINHFWNGNSRLTWQATPKNRFTFSTDVEYGCLCNAVGANLFSSNTSEEADQGGRYYPNNLYQATWNSPVTSKLLLEAGMTVYSVKFQNFSQPNAAANGISVVDSGLGLTYRAASSLYTIGLDPQQNYRLSASYVTGSHSYKVGALLLHGYLDENVAYNSAAVSYTFNNGTPTGLTEYASPLHTRWVISPTLGIYAQDQWTIKRLTLSYGVRYDHQDTYVPAQSLPAGVFVPARSFGKVPCVPCWNDIDPRFGVSYDLRGNGKTAIKASIGRFVLSQTTALASAVDPANSTVSSTTRSWIDNNHNFIPDCDLTNPAAQGPGTTPATVDTCGADANSTFGKTVVTTTYDPNVLTGWENRPYDWQLSAGVQHQFGSRMALGAMYFRTWYGNFTVTDNLDVAPTDYSPYCFTAPTNSQLPGGGGNQVCGLYDLNPNKVGQVNNYVTFASKYGNETEVYQGVDVVGQARFGHAEIGGGFNIGNTNGITSSQSDCFVVDSPQQLYQCNQPFPYQLQAKVQGTYDLPWSIQAGATFQSLPGIPITATYAVPNALIAPSLGRNLSQGSTASVPLIRPNSVFGDRINQVDMRVSKAVHFGPEGRVRTQVMVDLANAFNASPVTAVNPAYGSKWLTPTQILDPRLVKFGAKVEF